MGSLGEASTETGDKKGLSKSSDLHIDDTAGMWTMFFVLVDEVHTTISIEAGGDLGGDFLAQDSSAHADKKAHKAQVHQHRVISGYKATLKSTPLQPLGMLVLIVRSLLPDPRVSETAKSNARERLEALGVSE